MDWTELGPELRLGAVTLLTAVYGPASEQLATFQRAYDKAYASPAHGDSGWRHKHASAAVRGALQNLRAELEAGLVGDLRRRLTAELLTDFLQLARAALDDTSDGAKNVAAVLSAAAFEDAIRRLGRDLAGRMGKDDLNDVIAALRENGILESPQLGIALSYLNFRNRALHADWTAIDRSSVHSVLGFVEQLLLKHYG